VKHGSVANRTSPCVIQKLTSLLHQLIETSKRLAKCPCFATRNQALSQPEIVGGQEQILELGKSFFTYSDDDEGQQRVKMCYYTVLH